MLVLGLRPAVCNSRVPGRLKLKLTLALALALKLGLGGEKVQWAASQSRGDLVGALSLFHFIISNTQIY